MKDDYISREAALAAIQHLFPCVPLVTINLRKWQEKEAPYLECMKAIERVPAADVRPVVFCKDCIHRPYETVPGVRYGLTVESPDREYKCPCFCDGDGWYSYIPGDDFFCGNGERLREGGTP